MIYRERKGVEIRIAARCAQRLESQEAREFRSTDPWDLQRSQGSNFYREVLMVAGEWERWRLQGFNLR